MFYGFVWYGGVRWHKTTALEEDERMQEKREQSRAEVDVEVQYRTVQEFLGVYAGISVGVESSSGRSNRYR